MPQPKDPTLNYATSPRVPLRGFDTLAKTAILASVIQFLWFIPSVFVAPGVSYALHGGFVGHTLAFGTVIVPALVSVVCGVAWLIRFARQSRRGLILAVLIATVLAGGWLGGVARLWWLRVIR